MGVGGSSTMGLFVTMPRLLVPLKNSTVSTKPSGSFASAIIRMFAGAKNDAPLVGMMMLTLGGSLVLPWMVTTALFGLPTTYVTGLAPGEPVSVRTTVSSK